MSPALAGGFLITEPPGKSLSLVLTPPYIAIPSGAQKASWAAPSVISSLVYCQGSALPAGGLLPVYLPGLWNLGESHLWDLSRSGCLPWAQPLSAASGCPDPGPCLPPATCLVPNLSPAFHPKLHSPPRCYSRAMTGHVFGMEVRLLQTFMPAPLLRASQ